MNLFKWRPFQPKYWVVWLNGRRDMCVVRQWKRPTSEFIYSTIGMVWYDGPFNTREEAAESMAFWEGEYRKRR